MNEYLQPSEFIDSKHPKILDKAQSLTENSSQKLEIARRCFSFVRDEIKHSYDFKLNPVTCKASDVLQHSTGYCYAKSHLLAALLRANNIPAGLCYQRLRNNGSSPFCLHGLNAVYLEQHGWYRVDARGNKEGVRAKFTPPLERLAYAANTDREFELPEIFSEPLTIVTDILMNCMTYNEVADNLPDMNICQQQ